MPTPPKKTSRIEQWISLSDFTPGCFDNSYISRITPVVPARIGSADARYTVGCMALTTGGLAPLPKFTTSYDAPSGTDGYMNMVGFYAASTYEFGSNDVFLMMFQKTTGSKEYWQWWDYQSATGTAHKLLTGTVTAPAAVQTPWPFMTRAIVTTKTGTTYTPTPTTTPGKPVIIVLANTGTDGQLQAHAYPNVTSPTTHEFKKLGTHPTVEYIIGYQGRVLGLQGQPYTWPGQIFTTNENLCYTTPANTFLMGDQNVVLDPTDPFGFGAWGSISAGELFLVKNRGGGLVLTGDVNFPSVTKLPGVQSTGHLYSATAQTPAGLFYCSQDQGAWLWNGGNTSQKISQNIDDGFFYTATNPQNAFCQTWGEWVLFSNSWLYNIRIQSWWKLSKPTLFWFYPARTIFSFYAGVYKRDTTAAPVAYKMTKKVPGETWTWQSLPIKVANNRYINIREIVLYASNPSTDNSTVNIKLYNDTGTEIFTYTTTAGVIGSDPTMIRVPAGGVTLDNIIVRMVGNGSGGAPIVHSLTIGVNVRQHVMTS